MPMPWRQFTLLCTLVISFFIYLIQPFQKFAYIESLEIDEQIGTVSDFEYPVLALSTKRNGEEFFAINGVKKLCSRYFFTIRYGGETYVGFYLSVPSENGKPNISFPLLFPRKSFMIVSTPHRNLFPPTVTFSNGSIILRMNQTDIDQSHCFKDRVLV